MKFRKLNILTAFVLGATITLAGCSKDDGPIPKRIGIEEIPAMTMNLEPQKKDNIDTIKTGSPAAFTGKFKVAVVFPDQAKPTKVDIVVRKNASAANVKMFKADVSAFPTSFTVTAAEIAALFGAPVALNDTYDFAPDIYTNGKKYEAFPAVSAGNGSGVVGMNSIGFYEFVRITVKN
ncbi:MAG: hypothetical protein EOO10_08710 [Chitinophagaceae bacterium]|nr:MAG: hypothetical protein EOO10_08710 [Chitinophagaceae bacterium]